MIDKSIVHFSSAHVFLRSQGELVDFVDVIPMEAKISINVLKKEFTSEKSKFGARKVCVNILTQDMRINVYNVYTGVTFAGIKRLWVTLSYRRMTARSYLRSIPDIGPRFRSNVGRNAYKSY